jgi:hypothetical protein
MTAQIATITQTQNVSEWRGILWLLLLVFLVSKDGECCARATIIGRS